MGNNRRFAMNRKLSLLVVVCMGSVVLSLSLSQAAQTLAQGPQPPIRRPLKPADTLSSTFTYQGQL